METITHAPGSDAREERPGLAPVVLRTLLFARIVSNMSFRVLAPLLPAVARGLGVSLESAGRLVSIQGGVWILAPFLGQLSDHYGRRRLMEVGLLLLAVAAALVYLSPSFAVALVAFAAIGISRAIFDPTTHAYVGDAVRYADRGRAIAIISMGWSLAWLLGVPISGLLMDRFSWNVPWGFFSLLAVVALVATRVFIPPAPSARRREQSYGFFAWGRLLRRSRLRMALLAGFGIVFAVENLFIVYGAFLESRFDLSIGAIGLLSTVLGVSDLAGESASYLWTDRLGKRKSIVLGLAGYAVSIMLLLPFSNNLALSLVGFALVFFFFEFTIVSFFPLMSEVVPDARGAAISLNVAGMGSARLLAPLTGLFLYSLGGNLLLNVLLSASVCGVTAAILWWGVPE